MQYVIPQSIDSRVKFVFDIVQRLMPLSMIYVNHKRGKDCFTSVSLINIVMTYFEKGTTREKAVSYCRYLAEFLALHFVPMGFGIAVPYGFHTAKTLLALKHSISVDNQGESAAYLMDIFNMAVHASSYEATLYKKFDKADQLTVASLVLQGVYHTYSATRVLPKVTTWKSLEFLELTVQGVVAVVRFAQAWRKRGPSSPSAEGTASMSQKKRKAE
jgi:hypothetical protein